MSDARCWSCDHLGEEFHGPEGCRFTVTQGTEGMNLVCPCTVTPHVDGDPFPTTGGLVDYGLPDGCVCYIREDIDWGDVRTQPPGGCPIHSMAYGLDDLVGKAAALGAATKPCRPIPYGSNGGGP